MQLLVRRNQRKGGLLGWTTIFESIIRSEYTEEERAHINRHDLGGDILYDSVAHGHLSLRATITVASLQRGHTIECKDLNELVEAENTIVEACKGLRQYLENSTAFDGKETVVNLDGPLG
jgi:hypothetical protein